MKNIFDYTYFRIAKFYFKGDGLDATTSLLTISLIIYLYLLDAYLLTKEVLNIDNKPRITSLYEKIFVVFIMYLIYLYVKKIYQNKYLFLREKWINEEKNKKRINGFFVILFILSPLFLLVFIASLFGKANF